MNVALVRRFFTAYGLVPQMLYPPQKGYRNSSYAAVLNDKRIVNFILYKSESEILSRIRRTNNISLKLAASGIPVRYPVDKRIMQLRVSHRTLYGALYNYLPGETIPWEAYSKDHIKLVGMAMSTLHYELRLAGDVDNSVVDEYREIISRMQAYFTKTDVDNAMQEKLKLSVRISFKRLTALLNFCGTLPHQQPLHMDFVRGNLLFRSAVPGDPFSINRLSLSGIIDFEKVAWGHPLFDIARTFAFLLVDCSGKTPEQIKKYFLQSGYNRRGKASFTNMIINHGHIRITILDELVNLFLLYDFYKFLRHNPYESLKNNHHFIRTRNILIERKMLQYR